MRSIHLIARFGKRFARAFWQTWSSANPWQQPSHQRTAWVMRVAYYNWLCKPKLKDGVAKCGIGPVIALQGVLITEMLALLVYAYQEGITPSWKAVLAYILISLIPLALMCRILWLRSSAHSTTPAFDRSTIMFTRCSFGISVIMVSIATVLFWYGCLPQQPTPVSRLYRLSIHHVDNHVYDRPPFVGRPGLIVYIPLNKKIFSSGIPQNLQLQVTVNPQLMEGWQLTGTYNIQPTSCSNRKLPKTYVEKTARTDRQDVEIDDLYSDGDYFLVIPLAGAEKESKENQEKAKKQLVDEGGMTIIAKMLEIIP